MIWKPTYAQSTNKSAAIRNIAIVAVCAVLVAIGTFAVLTYLKAGQNTAQTTQTVEQPTETRSIEELKKSAFAKLQAGDQAGGVKELEAALAQAKRNKNQNEISYLEQQIDFAKNTPTSTKSDAPTSATALKDSPDTIRIVTPN